MEHDINLNIHYSAPKEVWSKIEKVYKSMPYWAENDSEVKWVGSNINSGLSIAIKECENGINK